MTKSELEKRTKAFAVATIKFLSTLPQTKTAQVLGCQLLKSSTSIGANYREANRAESRRDFIHKVAIIEKESAETLYWLELLHELNLGDSARLSNLHRECNELLSIFVSIGRSAKRSNSEVRNIRSKIE